ncbi:hypothetical protein Ciccas_004799 [Cichlidogyrus casuarinus]|uniref:FACT complex subunit SPT16 PH-like domain-containing protein n=1 Tax=Cichlidogyrus casuarinus TaxID=1844966 RepID=A0ABD2QAI6_9PLAT
MLPGSTLKLSKLLVRPNLECAVSGALRMHVNGFRYSVDQVDVDLISSNIISVVLSKSPSLCTFILRKPIPVGSQKSKAVQFYFDSSQKDKSSERLCNAFKKFFDVAVTKVNPIEMELTVVSFHESLSIKLPKYIIHFQIC